MNVEANNGERGVPLLDRENLDGYQPRQAVTVELRLRRCNRSSRLAVFAIRASQNVSLLTDCTPDPPYCGATLGDRVVMSASEPQPVLTRPPRAEDGGWRCCPGHR